MLRIHNLPEVRLHVPRIVSSAVVWSSAFLHEASDAIISRAPSSALFIELKKLAKANKKSYYSLDYQHCIAIREETVLLFHSRIVCFHHKIIACKCCSHNH